MKWLSGDQFSLLASVFIVLVVLLVIGGFGYVWLNTRTATAAADRWFALLQQGQFEEAYALCSPAFRQSISLIELRQRVELSGLVQSTQTAWSHRAFEKDTATLAGGISTAGLSTLQLAVRLDRNGESWLVNGVEISPLIGRKMRRFIDISVSPGFQINSAPIASEAADEPTEVNQMGDSFGKAIDRVFSFIFNRNKNGREAEDDFTEPGDKKMAIAIRAGDTEKIEKLFKLEKINPLATGRNAANWLVIAIAYKQKDAFEMLLSNGALGDVKGEIAGQALYSATLLDDHFWLERLHKAGADLNNFGGGDLLLVIAMRTGHAATLDFYLKNGARIDSPTNLRGTVALSAATINRFDLVNRFLDLGADPWVMDDLGLTLGYRAEAAAAVPAWNLKGQGEVERQRLLSRLKAIGFPIPAPKPKEGLVARSGGFWPPLGAKR